MLNFKLKIRLMTTNAQMIKNINAYVEAFLIAHGNENSVQIWKNDKTQQAFNKLTNDKKSSGKKDPNKPKRGKSAYIFFCADHREKVKEKLGDGAKATKVTTELGKQWNELKASTTSFDKKQLGKYEEQAKEDKERYEREMAVYLLPPSDKHDQETRKMLVVNEKLNIPKGLTPGTIDTQIIALIPSPEPTTDGKPNNYPEPPTEKKSVKNILTGYILFCREERPKVIEHYPDAKGAEVTKFLADLWKVMDTEEKNHWNNKTTN